MLLKIKRSLNKLMNNLNKYFSHITLILIIFLTIFIAIRFIQARKNNRSDIRAIVELEMKNEEMRGLIESLNKENVTLRKEYDLVRERDKEIQIYIEEKLDEIERINPRVKALQIVPPFLIQWNMFSGVL